MVRTARRPLRVAHLMSTYCETALPELGCIALQKETWISPSKRTYPRLQHTFINQLFYSEGRPSVPNPCNPVLRRPAVVGEISRNDDLAVRLRSNAVDATVDTGAGLKGGVPASAGIQLSDPTVGFPVEVGEVSADQYSPVRLEGNAFNSIVGTGSDVEGSVDAAVGVSSSNPILSDPVVGGVKTSGRRVPLLHKPWSRL